MGQTNSFIQAPQQLSLLPFLFTGDKDKEQPSQKITLIPQKEEKKSVPQSSSLKKTFTPKKPRILSASEKYKNKPLSFFQFLGVKVLLLHETNWHRPYAQEELPVFLHEIEEDSLDTDILFENLNDRPKIKKTLYFSFYLYHDPTIVFIDEYGIPWNCSLTFDERVNRYPTKTNLASAKISSWKTGGRFSHEYIFLQDDVEIHRILSKVNPYGLKWAQDFNVPINFLAQFPFIETLKKAEFWIADLILNNEFSFHKSDSEYLNKLLTLGSSPKDIFKCSKGIYNLLKNEENLALWDLYRRIDKFKRLSIDTLKEAYENNFSTDDMDLIYNILSKTYNGKQVFSFTSLLNYLDRIDTFQAIPRKEGLLLIKDYLSCCIQLQMEPRIDSDSLKREHDIAAKNLRIKIAKERDSFLQKGMAPVCQKMKNFNYEESIFFVRAVESLEDLLDEANQQHNCVACYADRIVKNQSYIFVLRETRSPEISLVTIELSPDGKKIRQKYLAYNKPIKNKSITDFIERWHSFVKKKMLEKTDQN